VLLCWYPLPLPPTKAVDTPSALTAAHPLPPAGIAPPLILPVIICSLCLVVEVIGDVTATRSASRLETSGDEHNDSVSGGIRADGISTFLGALATAMPVVCFAQNNGVIQLTNCASRWGGLLGTDCWWMGR
jgi:xanthine/uracil permease